MKRWKLEVNKNGPISKLVKAMLGSCLVSKRIICLKLVIAGNNAELAKWKVYTSGCHWTNWTAEDWKSLVELSSFNDLSNLNWTMHMLRGTNTEYERRFKLSKHYSTLDMYVIISREVIWYRDKKHTSRSVGKTSNEVSKLYAQRNVEEN